VTNPSLDPHPSIHLRAVELRPSAREREGFPFDLPLVQHFEPIPFDVPVTFLVGENAAGKSTFLEALASAAGSIVVGGEDLAQDPTMEAARDLGRELKLVWNRRTGKGFFLRAEDFFNYARRLNRTRAEMDEMADDFDQRLSGYGRQLARGAVLGQKAAIDRRYGGDLDARSHGEGFLALFQSRLVPGGLYLLDEPEAALSPTSQLGLIAMIKAMLPQRAQFIIATHSPMLMAFPDARILSFDEHPVGAVDYDDVAHVRLWREFLERPDRYLRQL
jgi:predicted ATPase